MTSNRRPGADPRPIGGDENMMFHQLSANHAGFATAVTACNGSFSAGLGRLPGKPHEERVIADRRQRETMTQQTSMGPAAAAKNRRKPASARRLRVLPPVGTPQGSGGLAFSLHARIFKLGFPIPGLNQR
ncbi:MAG: hypothetical protein GX442_24230 [Candidatus Riflebacteria bacterium]|nr:hypothetical protein [Candidatus Riflebacteria bacterium]